VICFALTGLLTYYRYDFLAMLNLSLEKGHDVEPSAPVATNEQVYDGLSLHAYDVQPLPVSPLSTSETNLPISIYTNQLQQYKPQNPSINIICFLPAPHRNAFMREVAAQL